jgi:hypothetical protein
LIYFQNKFINILMNRLTATVLCGGLALAGCDRSDFRPEQLEAASRQGAETG